MNVVITEKKGLLLFVKVFFVCKKTLAGVAKVYYNYYKVFYGAKEYGQCF